MATEERRIVLTELAHAQVSEIHLEISQISETEAEAFINDFLDVVFEEIKHFPLQFEPCQGIRSQGGDYRIASIYGNYRVIFQVFKKKTMILLVLHESELPF